MEQFFRTYQKELLEFANLSIGRHIFARLGQPVKNRIVKITPDSFHEETSVKDTYQATFFSNQRIGRAILLEFRKYKEYERWNNQTFNHIQIYQSTTFNPVAGAVSPCDGTALLNVAQPGVGFSTILVNAGTDANDTNPSGNIVLIQSASSGSGFVEVDRSIFNFNTASLSAGAKILTAVFSLYSNGTGNSFGAAPQVRIVSATPGSFSAVVAADYLNLGSTQLAALILSSIVTSQYNDFGTTNLVAVVNKIGVTSLGTVFDWDGNGTFSGSYINGGSMYWNVNYADNGTNIPKLVITYTVPGANFAAFL